MSLAMAVWCCYYTFVLTAKNVSKGFKTMLKKFFLEKFLNRETSSNKDDIILKKRSLYGNEWN